MLVDFFGLAKSSDESVSSQPIGTGVESDLQLMSPNRNETFRGVLALWYGTFVGSMRLAKSKQTRVEDSNEHTKLAPVTTLTSTAPMGPIRCHLYLMIPNMGETGCGWVGEESAEPIWWPQRLHSFFPHKCSDHRIWRCTYLPVQFIS